ncbi:MAG: hypothetical protein IPN26_14030 [Bacteroidetes bacterium]|nr:hypothetical protein [Bacteroidota bacterium]
MGFIWGFIKPLLYLFIFIIIFSAQFTSISNYVLYTTSGLIFWFFFANMTSQGAYSIIASSGIIKSLKLQTILFPLAEGMSELFNLCFMQLIRQVLYENRHPDLQVLLTCSFLSIGSFMVGYFIFHRLKNQFITAI